MGSEASEIVDLYNRLIAINRDAFQNGFFDVAYVALSGALHCAEKMEMDQPLVEISQLADEQSRLIDKRSTGRNPFEKAMPESDHLVKHFDMLSAQAKRLLKIREIQRWRLLSGK